jgi:hypothetical protein
MDSIAIYPQENGSVAFLYGADECGLSMFEIARKDVPAGVPFLIVPDELVPTDHTFFEAFEADFSNPDGYGIGYVAWFEEQKSKEQL